MSPTDRPNDDASSRHEHAPDPYRWLTLAMTCVLTATLPLLLIVIVTALPKPPVPAWTAEAARLDVSSSEIALGEVMYRNTCALCHGKNGEGVPRLGKPLRNSAYVQEHTDNELLFLIANGRLPSDPENTTGALMPARGGQGVNDRNLAQVVTYLRAIQDPARPTVSIEDWIIETGGGAEGAQVAGLVGSEVGVGHDLFVASCSACHGSSGEGMEGLGKPLSESPFVESKSDKELIAFIKTGRPIWDELNTSGIDMPPKGGNPAITDEQLADIVKYIRSLHE